MFKNKDKISLRFPPINKKVRNYDKNIDALKNAKTYTSSDETVEVNTNTLTNDETNIYINTNQ